MQLYTNKETYLTLTNGATTSLHNHIKNIHYINIAKAVSSRNFLVVSLFSFDRTHTRINIANTLFSICNDFNITNKILEIAVDNALNNNILLKVFEFLCYDNSVIFIKQESHIYCITHIINFAL